MWGCSRSLSGIGRLGSSLIARDRLGEKPLYYGWQGDTFLFASELRALHSHPDFRPQPSRDALCLLLRYGYIPAPHSIYEGIFKLPPASYLSVSLDERASTPNLYWSFAAAAQAGEQAPFEGDDRAATDELEDHLRRAIQSQCVADVPLGALLSGGIDSSTVVALMRAKSSQQVKTFTIGFAEEQYNEAAHAAEVAKYLETDHTELIVSPADALSLIPQLPKLYDEPFGDSSQIPTQLVMQLARRRVTVALSGDGGDELFGGYNRYRFIPELSRRIGRVPMPLRRALGTSLLALSSAHWDYLLRPVAPVLGITQIGEKLHKFGTRINNAGNINDLFLPVHRGSDPADVVGGRRPAHCFRTERLASAAEQCAQMMALIRSTYLTR